MQVALNGAAPQVISWAGTGIRRWSPEQAQVSWKSRIQREGDAGCWSAAGDAVRHDHKCTYFPLRVVFITKIRITRWCKEPICSSRVGWSGEAEDPVRAACVKVVHFWCRRWPVLDFTPGIVCALTYNTVGDCTASNSPGRGRRVISDRTPRPPRRAQIGVPHVSGAGRVHPAAADGRSQIERRTLHAVPRLGYRMYPVWDGARTAFQTPARLPGPRQVVARSPRTATPGRGTHSTLWRAQTWHALHRGNATPSLRHRPAPSHSCRHRDCTTTPSPPRLISPSPPRLFFFPPSPSPFVSAPLAPPFPPFFFFLGASLRREARYPAGGCGPDRDRPPLRVIGCPRSRGLCPPCWGHPLVFWCGRHARWAVFTVFAFSSTRRWVLVGPLTIAH